VLLFDRKHYGRMWRNPLTAASFLWFLSKLRHPRYTTVLDLQGLFRSGFLAYASGAERRVGLAGSREGADRFYTEVRRVARPDGILAALTYGLLEVDGKIDPVLARFYTETVGSYWPPERKWVDAGYATLPFPFEAIVPPSLTMEAEWTFPQLLGYLGTWSAVKEYRRRNGTDPLALIRDALQDAWGESESAKKIAWPIRMRIGRVGKKP